MIRFREKRYSGFGNSDIMIKRITDNLDRSRIYDYEVISKIGKDICINASLDSTEVYIPEDRDFIQYPLEDFISKLSPFIKTRTTLDRDTYIVRIQGRLTLDQYIKIVKYIISEEGFCSIVVPSDEQEDEVDD